MNVVWIIGSGGLLGSALSRQISPLTADVFQPGRPVVWTDAASRGETLAAGVREFSKRLTPGSRWEIYWAAGLGHMGSAPAQLESETEALNTLLREVAQDDHLRAAPGSIAFASSAGALYAGCTDDTVTEVSEVVPTTHYSIEKLKQEALLRNFHLAGTTRVLIARISTLFGPKARGRANKGLIANLARSMLNHEPVRIFVPLDTMRDYIYADDAANAMINTLRSMPATSPFRIKILASQRVTTVAEIIALIGRVAHRHPRIITGATALTSKYAARITFRSCEGEDTAELYRTALHVGIARVLESERLSFVSPNPRS